MSSLRKSNDIKSIFQVFISCEVLAHHVNLCVGILEETIESVFKDSIPNLYRLDINVRHLTLHLPDQAAQAQWVTAAVT